VVAVLSFDQRSGMRNNILVQSLCSKGSFIICMSKQTAIVEHEEKQRRREREHTQPQESQLENNETKTPSQSRAQIHNHNSSNNLLALNSRSQSG